MEVARKNRPRSLFSNIFHILHVCVSVGLVIAVVRNQLVNESRFERLERNDCNCPSEEPQRKDEVNESLDSLSEQSSSPPRKDKTDSTTAHSLFKRTLDDQLDTDRDIPALGSSMNKSLANNTILKKTEYSTSARGISSNGSVRTQNSSGEEYNVDQTKKHISLKKHKAILKILGKEAQELFSCLDKLKSFMDSQIASGNTNSNTSIHGCRPLPGKNGLKGDPGEKGEPGQNGAMGPKGCSGTSFAYPTLESSPRYLVFNEGDPAVLSCNATANPPAQITWYRKKVLQKRNNVSDRYIIENRNIQKNKASSRAQMCPSEIPHPVTQSTLVIKQSRGSDTGTFVCKARNMMGAVSYEIQVLVRVYVRCSAIPSSITAVQSDDVQLSCRASGAPTPVITWYKKDRGPMPSQYNISEGDLHIYEISKEEEGTFVCLATNVLGSKTSEATVTVNVFPKITSFRDQPITINESQTLFLPCNATGYPKPEIRWSKVNDSLPEGRFVYDSQLLNISRIKYEDRGEYVCSANNTVGRTEKKITVIVQVGPKITKSLNAIEYGYRGKSKTLLFQVFAFPAAKITWRKPNNEEVDQGRFQQTNGSLFISKLKYTDSGRYQATAKNIFGEVKLTTFLVVRDAVPAAIRSVQPHATISIIEGRNLTEVCRAVGVPTPEMVWTHKGNKTINITRTTTSLPLNIINVGEQHAGRYTCTAKNEFGFEKQYFNLTILQRWVTVERSHSNYYYNRYRYKNRNRWSGELKSQYFSNGRRKYSNQLYQYWKLKSNTRIGIYFKVFSTELCCDKVKIYDGSSISAPLVGEFSGNVLPPNVTSSSNQLFITFTTDDSKPGIGFRAAYRSIP